MSRILITDIVQLTRDGWRPYGGRPEGYVYERLGCPYLLTKRNRPDWFVKSDLYLCVGCARRCSLVRPDGFPLPLPIRYPKPRQPYTLTPYEMVERKPLLTVRGCLLPERLQAHGVRLHRSREAQRPEGRPETREFTGRSAHDGEFRF